MWLQDKLNNLDRSLILLGVLGVLADASPQAVVVLLPQADFVVPARHAQDISCQRPANVPNDVVERVEDGWSPGGHVVGVPDNDAAVLRAAGDSRSGKADARRPSDITHPVGVLL